MADEIDGGDIVSAEPDAKTPRPADEIRKSVRETVTAQHADGTVRQRVVNELVDEQISERVALLRKALTKREELSKKVNQIRPDNVGYDIDGKKVVETYSKAKLDERKQALEALDKADKAIDKAVNLGDYELVRKLIG